MATQFYFNGRLIKLPGSYSKIEAAVNNQPLDLSYGNVLIIDKNPDNPFGGGSGVVGDIASKIDSVYEFDNLTDFRNFIRGGELYDYALPLFRPNGPGSLGISKLYYVRALTTTAGTLTVSWTGGGSSGGNLTIQAKHEGEAGNGVEGNETLASQTLEVTAVGSASDTIEAEANSTSLGTYVSNGTDTTTQAAASLAATINANTFTGLDHGYTATAVGAVVTIYAPANSGAAANAYAFVANVTGTATATVGAATMAGGVDGDTLTRGLAMTMEAGVVDPAKFIVKFWRGTFTGLDAESHAYGGVSEADTEPELIAQSPEFNNITEVISWMNTNLDFNTHMKLQTSVTNGSGVVDAADLAATTGNQLFSGGTQTYATARVDDALDSVQKLDYTFVLSMDHGSDYNSADNGKILSHLVTEAKYDKFLFVGGGDSADEFTSVSIAAAQFYDSPKAHVVHGGCNVTSQQTGTGLKEKDALYKAAHVLGRICGLEPQTPVTFKGLGYQGEVHNLTETEKETALDNGVLVTGFDGELGTFVVILGNNTLQANSYIVNEDATSHLISVNRIAAQLNKELEVNSKIQLLGNQSQGPNVGTLNKEVVRNWVAKYLKKKTATATVDNLIISFQDVVVTQDQDAYKIKYGFKPNTEINKLFFIGTILDPNA